jgi:hypothetical protein
MTDTPPDWVLIEAAKRSDRGPYHLKETYQNVPTFRALCDMILKHEQPPVDRKRQCAEYAFKVAREGSVAWGTVEIAAYAIELWEEGFGK